MRNLIKNVFRKYGYEIRRIGANPYFDTDNFKDIYNITSPYSMVPWTGHFDAHWVTKYAAERFGRLSIVETGVYRGGTSATMALTAMAAKIDFHSYLYDTFEGMPETDNEINFVDIGGGRHLSALDVKQDVLNRRGDEGWNEGPIDLVEEFLTNGCGLARENFTLVKGMVEDTLPLKSPIGPIHILRLDTDFYESILHCLKNLYEKVTPGGVVIIDDYGAWQGAREAVDEFIGNLKEKPLVFPNRDYGALMWVKTD